MIKELKAEQRIENVVFMVNQVTSGITNTGAPYLNITLQDKTGTIEAKKWDVSPSDSNVFVPERFVMITGDVLSYRNNLQIKILKGTLVNENDVKLEDFIKSAPISQEELVGSFGYYLGLIKDKNISDLVKKIIDECYNSFVRYPAACHNHHEYLNGLIHHTVGMLKVAEALANLYTFNTDYLYAGIILHDIGKIEELNGPVATKFTFKGKLLGHISIMQAKVFEVCEELKIDTETATILQHIVLSHHGKKEFGSPVEPMTKEAEIINLIDNIDSKMNMIDKALEDTEEGEFSQRIFAMDNRAFYKPIKK